MDDVTIGGARRARTGYSLDEISLVPRRRTRDRSLIDLSWRLDAYAFDLPLMSAPLDAVTSPASAAAIAARGGLGVLNLEGLWVRYDDPTEVLAEIAALDEGTDATSRLQEFYDAPVREELIGKRVEELKANGFAAGSLTPQKVERYHHVALEAGLDLLVVQGVVVTAQHVAEEGTVPLDLRSFTARYDIPVVVGGVASAKSALHLMRTGAVGVIVGVGAGSASTTQRALGVAVPQATAIADVAAARGRYLEESGRYVQVIATGGIRTGGDVAKAIACGADAVMLGRALAGAHDAPGGGAYWGLAAAHHELPRGEFVRIDAVGSLDEILVGPSRRDDGTENLFGGLRRALSVCGYEDLRSFRGVDLIVHT